MSQYISRMLRENLLEKIKREEQIALRGPLDDNEDDDQEEDEVDE